MKNIAKMFLALAAGVSLSVSCAYEAAGPLASSVSFDTATVSVEATGGVASTVSVKADGDWVATVIGCDWLTFSPSSGTGNGTITLTAADNVDAVYKEVQGPRKTELSVIGKSGIATVTVNQKGESGLDATRRYKKVASASDFEAGKAYLLTASDEAGAVFVAKPADLQLDNSKSYSYLMSADASAESDVILQPNGSNGFTFEAVSGGYAIKQSTGGYLYQSGTYANFYATADINKASVWSLDIAADGKATIKNVSNNDKIFQYDCKTYKNFGAWSGLKGDGYTLPVLYKDSAAPSDEVLSVADSTSVSGSATSVSLTVKSNRTWKVRNHDEWIKSFTKSGSGDGKIDITFDANTSYDEDRVAVFTIIGETTNFNIKVAQSRLFHTLDVTVADFLAAPVGDQQYRLTGKLQSEYKASSGNVYIEDATGYVYIFGLCETEALVSKSYPNLGLRPGDIITVVGKRGQYASSKVEDQKEEMVSAWCESSIKSKDVTVKEFLALPVASTYLVDQYCHLTGKIKSVVNSTNGNFYLEDTSTGDYVYVYGLTQAPVAKNDKSFANLGLKEGDLVTIVGQRGYYGGAKVADQKDEVVNGYYVSHTPAN